MLASINLPGLKWVPRTWVQEHSHIPWASNLDSRTVSPRLGVLPAGLKLSSSWIHPELPALLTQVIVYICHYCTSLHEKPRCDPAREQGAECHWLHLHQEWDFQQELIAMTIVYPCPSCTWSTRKLQNWKMLFCPLHLNVQPRGKSVLEAAGCFAAGGIFLGTCP